MSWKSRASSLGYMLMHNPFVAYGPLSTTVGLHMARLVDPEMTKRIGERYNQHNRRNRFPWHQRNDIDEKQ